MRAYSPGACRYTEAAARTASETESRAGEETFHRCQCNRTRTGRSGASSTRRPAATSSAHWRSGTTPQAEHGHPREVLRARAQQIRGVLLARPGAWRALDLFVAAVMLTLGVRLALEI